MGWQKGGGLPFLNTHWIRNTFQLPLRRHLFRLLNCRTLAFLNTRKAGYMLLPNTVRPPLPSPSPLPRPKRTRTYIRTLAGVAAPAALEGIRAFIPSDFSGFACEPNTRGSFGPFIPRTYPSQDARPDPAGREKERKNNVKTLHTRSPSRRGVSPPRMVARYS